MLHKLWVLRSTLEAERVKSTNEIALLNAALKAHQNEHAQLQSVHESLKREFQISQKSLVTLGERYKKRGEELITLKRDETEKYVAFFTKLKEAIAVMDEAFDLLPERSVQDAGLPSVLGDAAESGVSGLQETVQTDS